MTARPPEWHARRAFIVDSAARLFDNAGYSQTSMKEIARACSISKPGLYHYIESKDEILASIHDHFIDELIERQVAYPNGMPALEFIHATIVDILRIVAERGPYVRVFFEHYRELNNQAAIRVRAKREAYQRALESAIQAGVASGEIRPVDTTVLTLSVFGMANWSYQWLRSDGRLTVTELGQRMAEIVSVGISASPCTYLTE